MSLDPTKSTPQDGFPSTTSPKSSPKPVSNSPTSSNPNKNLVIRNDFMKLPWGSFEQGNLYILDSGLHDSSRWSFVIHNPKNRNELWPFGFKSARNFWSGMN